jgi:hypothetical protein
MTTQMQEALSECRNTCANNRKSCSEVMQEIYTKKPSRKENIITLITVLSLCGASAAYIIDQTKVSSQLVLRVAAVEKGAVVNTTNIKNLSDEIPHISRGIDSLLARTGNYDRR